MAVDKKESTPEQITKPNTISPHTLYRMYNAGVATLVFFRYITADPAVSPTEYVPDIFIHLFEALAPNSVPALAIAANGLRAAQAAHGFFHPKDSDVQPTINGLDILNHIGNMAYRMS